jgi:hypothetical protein
MIERRPRLHDRLLLVAAILLIAVAAVYQYVGFRSLLFGAGPSVPVDIRLRWIESQLLIEGKDSHTWGHPDPELPPALRWQRTLGGGYPPWATAIGLVVAPPLPWSVARTWFAILNVGALAVICAWGYSIGARYSRPFGLFLVAALLACAPVAICVSYGQYPLLIAAALVVAAEALERNRKLAGGLALGFALVKPQLAAMAVVATLIRRQYAAFAIACVVVLIGCGVMWAFTGIDPISALRDSQKDAKIFSFLSVNPLTAWLLPVLGFELTTLLLGLSFLAAGSVAAWSAPRNSRLTTLFAIAVIISMFWSYRRGYDCALLVIPMVLMFEVAARHGSAAGWILAFAFGVSLWLPVRNEQWSWTGVQIAHLAVWVTAAVSLYLSDSPEESCSSDYSAERMRMEALA